MDGQRMTNEDLTRELAELRRRVAEFESLEDRADAIIDAMGDGGRANDCSIH
jgi:hypothetical protein